MIRQPFFFLYIVFILLLSSCSSQGGIPILIKLPTKTPISTAIPSLMATGGDIPIPSTPVSGELVPVTGHSMRPADVAPTPVLLVHDVTSTERGAPYGDAYQSNLLERPFLSDMTYVPDLDIDTFQLSEDQDWHYVSIELRGSDPNNPLGIHYGAEFDRNGDGFGDILIWAQPPYTAEWSTASVKIFTDSNRDTAGRSSNQADADFEGNGYDTLVFDGSSGEAADPDLAWVRFREGTGASIEFAFKKTLTGSVFLLGVIADAGLKDVSMFAYNDRFRERHAGSPVPGDIHYPLNRIYAVDNTCWKPVGMQNLRFLPKLCPSEPGPAATNRPSLSGSNFTTTSVPPTAISTIRVQPTSIPPTSIPPTLRPPTGVPPTSVPPTLRPPTGVPPTSVPPTLRPPTSVPPTSVPPTSIPPTSEPPTSVPSTSVPTEPEEVELVICHIPPGNPDNRQTKTVSQSAWENEHSKHGDSLGPC